MTASRRRYVAVNGRRVHYRRQGSGPPLVLLHGSPGNSEMLAGQMDAAARHFTCFALDTPGFGGSDALPGDRLTVADLADATAAAMAALGLPPCLIYGTHTGAAIATELGARWPECAAGLILEGLPIFTESESTVLFRGYFAPMVVDPLGGHLTATWIRFRDQFTWFPWPSRDVTRLNPLDRPTPEDIHQWVMMFYRACRTYEPAYRAACFYGQGAYLAAEALTLPAVFTASAEDMLFPHLGRLPPLKGGQRIEKLPSDPQAKYAALIDFAKSLPVSTTAANIHGWAAPASSASNIQFIDTADGQIFVRNYGDTEKPALILLHDAPGTGLLLENMARLLAQDFYVVLPDLPGTGESDAPAPERSVLCAAADALPVIADALGVKRFTLAAIGCGCAVAAAFAGRRDSRLNAILLEDAPEPNEAIASAIAPKIPLSPEGAHWVQAWLMVRDSQIYKPWYDGRVEAQKQTQGIFDADWLHDQTFALMKSRTSYYRLPREAYRYDIAAELAKASAPVRIASTNGMAALIFSTILENTE